MATNRPESAASKASRVAPVDTASLSFEDVETPTRAGSAAAPDPLYVEQIRVSMTEKKSRPTADNPNAWVGKGRAVTVPRSQVPSVLTATRNAAESLGAGATFSYWIDGTQVKPETVLGVPASRDGKRAKVDPTVAPTKRVQIRFAAKSPKQKRAKTTANA